MITTNQLRQQFIDFFVSKSHTAVPSASLIPENDPTLLFVNAGMVPFKHVFLGAEQRPYTRATAVQRCIRAGGKHNDLENVGYTARHHTFFEMLGNFSFGDYFKQEAIEYAWEFLTEVIKLPKEKLWVTVFEEDQEAEEIWLKHVKVDPQRFSRIGAKDNFWTMGDTGPCGPCTEIFYDHGPDVAGGPPGTPEEDGDRYIEIWNLVFMQYNRTADGKMEPLPKPSVDTGMGIERLAAVLQGVHDNYHTDTFQHIIKAMAKLAGTDDLDARPLRVIADHIRACSFLILDGVVPSNEGRGYVLRRIMRRAIRYGHKLGVKEPFFYKLVQSLAEAMGEAYPELVKSQYDIRSIILREEEQFARTLDQGLKILEEDIAKLQGDQLPGATVFKLYDTYGFPADLTADIVREQGMTIDEAGFESCMAEQRARARAASQFKVDYNQTLKLKERTEFVGYAQLSVNTEILRVLDEAGKSVEGLEQGMKGALVLASTTFYAESGGQVGDQGEIRLAEGVFSVFDTQKHGEAFVHFGVMQSGECQQGKSAEAIVDQVLRRRSAANHSATHLLHAALRNMLGGHVVQKGSLVTPDRLRFDFSHHQPVQQEELRNIEDLINDHVRANHAVEVVETTPDDAKKMGALALFGEKYGETVRVLKMGDFSVELCGGTHVQRTGDIGLMKIVSEAGIASGVRRIEAITGHEAVDWTQSADQICIAVADILNTKREEVADKLQQVFVHQRALEKELAALKQKLASSASGDLLSEVTEVAGVPLLVAQIHEGDAKSLRTMLDELKNRMGSGVIVLGLAGEGKVNLISGVTADFTDKIKAGALINFVAQQVGGKGGGRPDMAQAGGSQPDQLPQALASIATWIEEQM